MSELLPTLPLKVVSTELLPANNSHVTRLRTVFRDADDVTWVFDPSVLNIELKPYVEPRGRYRVQHPGNTERGPVYVDLANGTRHPGCYSCGLPLCEHRDENGKRSGCPENYEAILKEIIVPTNEPAV